MTSDEAPTSLVVTVTTGSSMRGYSRTARRSKDTRPTSRIISDITVAKTGRRIEISEMRMAFGSPADESGCSLRKLPFGMTNLRWSGQRCVLM
jgi:hypothetical protein